MTAQSNQAYNDRVRAIAEEMAAAKYPDTFRRANDPLCPHWVADYYKKQTVYVTELMLPAARIAIKHMGESFRDCHEWIVCNRDCDSMLIKMGLIPDQESISKNECWTEELPHPCSQSAIEAGKCGCNKPDQEDGTHEK